MGRGRKVEASDMTLPALFVSHGSPTLVADDVPARAFLAGLAAQFPRPRSILMVSAHWETDEPTVGATPEPETIHDFYGFPDALYQLRYPAPGDPELAEDIATRLTDAGFAAALDHERGLDHGAWAPAMLAWPAADLPVLQLSIQPGRDTAHHVALGRALAPLRDEVLIVGSGNATHDLRGFRGQAVDAPPFDYAAVFDRWLEDVLMAGDEAALIDYRRRAPEAARNHPTEDHLLPLHVAFGAGGKARRLHDSFTFGMLSMAAYAFD